MSLHVWAPDGVPEITAGTDLVTLLPLADLVDGDVVVVTSKVVSKAEGRVRPGGRDEALAAETARVVARRGGTVIVRTRHGLTMAAAGIDASNVEQGSIVLLPEDPDASARRLRAGIRERSGRNVGVVVTDTAGRAWRHGQTDIAIGAAGLRVLEEYAGRVDTHGNELAVTAPAVADELAGAAELVQTKLGARPFAVVRGRPDLVLPPGEDGPGAAALVREPAQDLFGLGAREAVLAALAAEQDAGPSYGSPLGPEEMAEAVHRVTGLTPEPRDGGLVWPGTERPEAAAALALACGWGLTRIDGRTTLLPPTT